MRAGSLTWLAVRELWISFRFVALLALGLLGGVLAAVLPAGAADAGTALAWGVALAGTGAGAVAAGSVATERRRGRLAWLAVRSVPRSAVLLAWFGSLALPLLVGFAASTLLAWLALAGTALPPLDAVAFVALAAAACSVALAGLAVALLAGTWLGPLPAVLAGGAASGLLHLTGLWTGTDAPLSPVAGIGLLAGAASLERPLAGGIAALGMGLVATAAALSLAAAVLSRVDL